MTPRITEPSREDEAALHAFLDERLYEFNVQATGCRDGRPFAGVVHDEAGTVVAAIDGHTWGGSGYVVHLWVHESRRRSGIGSALLSAVEQEAQRRGCTQMLLTTHSFQAPAFYERHGYSRQATIPDYPRGHAQLLYLKRLGG